MSHFGEAMLDAIDARIAAAGKVVSHPATMQSRDATGPGGAAIFDGSTRSVPVKVPGSVHAFAGDRVGLAQFGTSDWIVVYCFSHWGDSESSTDGQMPSDSTTSTAFSDVAGPIEFSLRKRYDATSVRVRLKAGFFTNTQPSMAEFGLAVTAGSTGAVTDYLIAGQHTSVVSHVPVVGSRTFDGVTLPADLYTMRLRWRRNATAANGLSSNNLDGYSIEAREITVPHP